MDQFVLRELYKVTVRGKAEALQFLEPLFNLGLTEPPESLIKYCEASVVYRNRDFRNAVAIWDEIGDGPSLVTAESARLYARVATR